MNFGKTNVEKAEDTAALVGQQIGNGMETAVHGVQDAALGAKTYVTEKIDAMYDQAKPVVDRVTTRAHDMADHAIEGTRQAGARVKKTAAEYAGACETYVSEQPMRSVAIAAAAGATIAALILLSRNGSKSHQRSPDRQ
jgi:ElaB/YqjD/DUF883 family membrane-anchored ribosome-binding protein